MKKQFKNLTKEDFKFVNQDVSVEERTELMSLVNEYQDYFTEGLDKLCGTPTVIMDIVEIQEVDWWYLNLIKTI